MNLAQTQTLFTAGLVPSCSAPQRTRARKLIRDNDRIPPELALMIYGNNVSGARVKALATAYPACSRILGEACFNNIAQRFVDHTPSEQPDLNCYGATFSNFLNNWTTTQKQFSDYGYLGDLARLERLCHTAYYAEDDAPFDFTALAKASHQTQETLCFRLSHNLGLLQSGYPVMEIRAANISDGDAAKVQAGDLPEYLVVSRPVFQPHVERVDETTYRLLAACRDGKPFGHIVDIGKHRASEVVETLPGLIRCGWITGITVDQTGIPGDP